MNKLTKLKLIIVSLAVIASISVFFNIYLIITQTKTPKQENINNQQLDNSEVVNEDTQEEEVINDIDEKEKNEVEYIYKYIEGKEKQVIVEKEVEKTIEVPASSIDAIVTYIDAVGNTKIINLPSGTTISFSAGEHGTYDTVPSSITLTDNQELDITGSAYNPSMVEVNYIFKGFSYSGNVFECEYSLANKIVNAECKIMANSVIKNNVLYIQHDYIESSGTQYITTNIKPNGNERFQIEFTPLEWGTTTNYVICGARNSGTLGVYVFGSIAETYGGGARLANFGVNTALTKPTLNVKHTIKYDKEKMWYDGTQYTASGRQLVQVNSNMTIFAGNTESQPIQSFVKMKLHSFVVYDDSGNEKENWIPVQRVSDNAAGLLDSINGSFLGNSGTGVFDHPDIIYTSGVYAGRIIATGSYETGSTLTLTVVVNDGYKFVKWSDGNTSTTRTVTVGNNIPYTALFVPNN